jgi:hypothetical protein
MIIISVLNRVKLLSDCAGVKNVTVGRRYQVFTTAATHTVIKMPGCNLHVRVRGGVRLLNCCECQRLDSFLHDLHRPVAYSPCFGSSPIHNHFHPSAPQPFSGGCGCHRTIGVPQRFGMFFCIPQFKDDTVVNTERV